MKPWKIQKFFGDVIYDLRQRNLLLVAIMLVVAIIAVPVLISASGPGASEGPVGVTANASADAHPEGESAVLAYQPGVRNFKKRLRDLSSKDPFKQQFAAAAAAPALDQGTSTSTSTSGSGSSTTPGSSGSGGSSGNGSGKSKGKTKVKTETQTYVYETDVLVGESGGALTRLNRIPQFQFLPGPDKPVLVYLGTTSGGTQALFLVSTDVSSVGGQGTCFPTADKCQLLGLNPGQSADMAYALDGKTYHVQVAQIKRFTK
jgi:hypothetical protein